MWWSRAQHDHVGGLGAARLQCKRQRVYCRNAHAGRAYAVEYVRYEAAPLTAAGICAECWLSAALGLSRDIPKPFQQLKGDDKVGLALGDKRENTFSPTRPHVVTTDPPRCHAVHPLSFTSGCCGRKYAQHAAGKQRALPADARMRMFIVFMAVPPLPTRQMGHLGAQATAAQRYIHARALFAAGYARAAYLHAGAGRGTFRCRL